MSYKVLIVIDRPKVKDQWWTDGATFQKFSAARKHQGDVARKWNTSDTAILAPDGRVLGFLESLDYRAEEKKMRAEYA